MDPSSAKGRRDVRNLCAKTGRFAATGIRQSRAAPLDPFPSIPDIEIGASLRRLTRKGLKKRARKSKWKAKRRSPGEPPAVHQR